MQVPAGAAEFGYPPERLGAHRNQLAVGPNERAPATGGKHDPRRKADPLETSRPIIGLLGGIGAGKSYVAKRLAALGPARVVDADGLAHKALDACAADGRLTAALGDGFVIDARADRAALGERVFQDPPMLRRLERLVHPQVHTAIRVAIDDHRRGDGPPVLVLDVPLLIEVGLDRACDALWFIEVDDALRAERASVRGLGGEQRARRERFQSPLERKRARADLAIDNAVEPDALDQQIRDGLMALGLSLDVSPEDSAAASPEAATPTPNSP